MKRNPWRKGHLSIRLTRAMRLICIGFGFITSIGRQVGQQSKTPAERYLFIFNFFLLARCASERFYFHFSDGWIDIKGNCFKFLIEDKKVKNEIRGPCSFIPSSTSIMLFFCFTWLASFIHMRNILLLSRHFLLQSRIAKHFYSKVEDLSVNSFSNFVVVNGVLGGGEKCRFSLVLRRPSFSFEEKRSRSRWEEEKKRAGDLKWLGRREEEEEEKL